jgi:uncharacterized protein YndB with AHSA1/START domain
MTGMSMDRIEKKIVLRAALERVWSAISEAEQFGQWFGVAFDGPFVAGARLTGRIMPTTVDPQVAKLQQPHEGKRFEFHVDRIEPMRSFSFRWHPYDIDPGVDCSQEPMTRVVFELRPIAQGTELTISESGFERIPPLRRARAFAANDSGWTHQARLIEKYLDLRAPGAEPHRNG